MHTMIMRTRQEASLCSGFTKEVPVAVAYKFGKVVHLLKMVHLGLLVS
jgi:hypothetical protein